MALCCAVCTLCNGQNKPNILFCFADDWGRYASIYASVEHRPSINQVVKMPNIDRMARQGVLFKNAFVTAPSCTPCRSSLLSGQYFFRTGRGAILQGATWDASIPSYPLLLRDAGYHIGKSYKVWSPGTPADAPYGGQRYAYEKAGRDFNNYTFAKRPAEELYDLKNDPDQTRNLAADPAFADKKRELAERLFKVLTDAKDPRVIGDGQTFERAPFTDAQPVGAATNRSTRKARDNTAK